VHDLWPGCGYGTLTANAQGALVPGDDTWRVFLARPELAPVAESCDSERALHSALLQRPTMPVSEQRLARLQDADARENYAVFLQFRDTLLAAGSVQAGYLAQFRPGPVTVAPVFVDTLAQWILRHLLEGSSDAFEARAAEMLFRAQRITVHDGRVLAADRDTLDQRHASAGLGSLGRLLMQAQAPLRALDAPVLAADNQASYWQQADGRHRFLLDLTHEITRDVGHGLQFRLALAHSGLQALARVLERWVAHLLGVSVQVQPVQRIADAHWRWHVGLDAEATALLNDLYENREDRPVDDTRRARLLSLFRLDFADAAEMRADVAGRPVYLGMAMNAEGVLRLKPQNLLSNLPLRALS
jgi:hypothetical protein